MSRDAAVALVTESQLGGSLDGIRLHVLPERLAPGEAVATWRRDVFRAPAAGWLVFVDRLPGANWEHPCWYFFVDARTGDVQRHDATTPPLRLLELVEITDGRDNPPPGLSEESLERFSERLRSLPKPRTSRGQAYAFIISGGASQGNNHIRYWNDCAFIYRALVEYYGYADDHIRVCISDGTDPAPDRSDGTNSPPDLDGDGDDDIEYPATQVYIEQVFGELAATLNATDQLFIFTTDHGGQESGQDCHLNLWNFEELRDDELAALVAALPCQTILCAFEQCYSGGMIDDLAGDGRVIATAADWDEPSYAMGPYYIYDAFVYFWTAAVAWQYPDGTPVDADTDDDGLVSMHEAFLFAEANDQENETPQYSSTPADLGDIMTLYGNLEGVYLVMEEVQVDDDAFGASSGDGDGVIEYGETVELTLALGNLGLEEAIGVTGTLATTSPHVAVIAAEGAFGDIPSEGSGSNAQPFVIAIDSNIGDEEPLELVLSVSEEPATLALDVAARAPAYAASVRLIADNGDEDGLADPGEDVVLTLRFENRGGADSPLVEAVLMDAPFIDADNTPHAVPAIPAGAHADVAGFAAHISDFCPEVHTGHLDLDLTGPDDYEVWTVLSLMVGPWFDDVEMDMAWTLGAEDDDASTGRWERADPFGTEYNSQPVQPEDDHTPGDGHICFVTGNGTAGGAAGDNDVDGGKTTLLSPVFDLENATSATLSYWRWYTNDLGNSPNQDYWDVELRQGLVGWISLEHTTASDNSWTEHSFDLSDYIELAGEVGFRFVASDEGDGSLVEAAVDDIMVTILRGSLTSAPEPEGAPAHRLRLDPCFPNPMNPMTRIAFELATPGPASLRIFDVNGRLVKTLLRGEQLPAGPQAVNWNGRNEGDRAVASGVYFVRLWTPGGEITRSVTLVR